MLHVLSSLALCSCVVIHHVYGLHTEHVAVATGRVVHVVPDMFLGVTVGSSHLHYSNMEENFRNEKLIKYAKALRPSYVRFGGTKNDQISYNLTATKSHTIHDKYYDRYILPAGHWDELNTFIHKTGFKAIFGFNEFERKNGKWDPTNVRALLQYSHQKGYPFWGFELGNEPNLFHKRNNTIHVSEIAEDHQQFKSILESGPYKHSRFLGPDTAAYNDNYIKKFLSHGGSSVDVITFHSYYLAGDTAKVSDFTSAQILDKLQSPIQTAYHTAASLHPPKYVWLGETSSASGGGAPGLSDRYVAGFMWLDKLGVAARYGLKGVLRQQLFSGDYALISDKMIPNPDYWLTLLYKRLVGTKVFDVKTSSRNIRIYAHCTKHNNEYNYKPGSLTVYAMNLNTESIVLQFSHLHGNNNLRVFWLSPDANNLTSQKVKLNGNTIISTDGTLPKLPAKHVTSGSVTAPGKTFGYIVLPDANVADCKTDTHGHIIG